MCLPFGLGLTALPAHAVSLADLPVGAGYAAWELCTRSFVSGDVYDRVLNEYTAPKVQPLPWIWRIDRDPQRRIQVSTWLPAVEDRRVGLYRAGLGCTLVPPDAREAEVAAQPFKPVATPAPSQAPWPQGEAAADPSGLTGAQAGVLARHGALIFGEASDQLDRKRNTIALLVAQNGQLVHEAYRAGYQRRQPQLGWSMTKTVTALIAGLMHHDGRLKLDAPVGLREWQDSDKAKITWRQVLNHAPGLAWDEGYGGASDVTVMLYNHADQGRWAAARPLVTEPGSHFIYSTGFSNIAMLGLRRLAGDTHQAIYDYYQQRLFAPLGIRGGVIEPDASGTPVGGARGVLRPVDWLRLGQLVANHGQWQGKTLIAPAYMDFMVAASPASPEYGGSIWRLPAKNVPMMLRPRLPEDLVWFAGHMGQIMVVVPSRQLVVLRMGVAFDKDVAREQVFALVADLLAAQAPPAEGSD